jgi:hypothetical protein
MAGAAISEGKMSNSVAFSGYLQAVDPDEKNQAKQQAAKVPRRVTQYRNHKQRNQPNHDLNAVSVGVMESQECHEPVSHPSFQNPLVYVARTLDEADALCEAILDKNPRYVAIDTETSVSRQERRHAVSLIQIATFDICVLVQIYRMTEWVTERVESTERHPSGGSSRGHGATGKTVVHYVERPRKVSDSLRKLLENPDVIKVGCGMHADLASLRKLYGIYPK